MKIKRFIAEFEEIPPGYGIAYRSITNLRAVCYPIPLNFIVGWLYKTYQRLRYCIPGEFQKREFEIYQKAKQEAKEDLIESEWLKAIRAEMKRRAAERISE